MRRGLASSRQQARGLVLDGRVVVGGAPASKPDRLVAPDEPVAVSGPPPRFVSRGGEKLAGALDRFGVRPAGRWLDAGASTGGFTDCLLQAGAAGVVAVDVGRGQLHDRLRRDPRVEVHERTHVRDVDLALVGDRVAGAVADLSFISVVRALRPVLDVVEPGGSVLLLVKPQFEAGRREASRGRGVVRDPDVWTRVLEEVIAAGLREGASMMGLMVSPLRGADGNVEFFVHALAGSGDGDARRAAPDGVDWHDPAARHDAIAAVVAGVDGGPG